MQAGGGRTRDLFYGVKQVVDCDLVAREDVALPRAAALQGRLGDVKFRDMRLKELPN